MYLQLCEIHIFIKVSDCDVSFEEVVVLDEIGKIESKFIRFGTVH